MSIKKSTRIENYRMIHVWTDDEIGFVAEATKEEWTWATRIGDSDTDLFTEGRLFSHYLKAVDWIMDEWRLAKSPKVSWEEIAAEMAGDMGMEWEYLEDDVKQDLLDAARQMARMVR